MGKIVKFCSSCDEGFAEKFGFCPNCGASLQAFEMNPLAAAAATPPAEPVQPMVAAAPVVEEFVAAPVEEIAEVSEPILEIEEAPVFEAAPIEELDEIETLYSVPVEEVAEIDTVYTAPVEEVVEIVEPVVEPARNAVDTSVNGDFVSIIPATASAAPFIVTKTLNVDGPRIPFKVTPINDEEFHLTVIEENKDIGTRNGLLAGATGFMVLALMVGLVANLFSKDLEVGSISDDMFLASLIEDVPMDIQEEIEKKNKDEGGGGGGGGRDEQEETTKGDLADQTPDPIRPPDAKVPRLSDPSLVLPPPSTEGNQKFKKENQVWGDPNGRFTNFSNGTGTGGGQGSGTGTGQGSGRGTGAGSGTGSGYGSGIGTGNGGGSGVGDGDGGPPPPVVPRGVTQGMKIISKPRPGYTDAARQNNIQGTVILRVTFLASGQIGSVSVVKGLPNGLSEKAIAAAKGINFEPAKTNGVGQSVTKQVEYSFSIY